MTACGTCSTELRPNAKFCDECGSSVTTTTSPAEYKQVTVLFADVVHSMDIASVVGPERLREIMTSLLDLSRAAVERYGGRLDKFTGDGIMAVFGAPVALEDHAFRACLAAMEIHTETAKLAADVERSDAITVQLRIGLNSGQVIAGEIGSKNASYTAIGQQVGMAQRMESVAPPGGVMLSDSTARLVENAVDLGNRELVHIKGSDTPVAARLLLAVGEHPPGPRTESKLVGRTWELNAVAAILEETTRGLGGVVNIVGPAGIGKSRLVRETSAIASARNVPVFTTYCESHTSDIPFHVVARLIRGASGLEGLDPRAARARLRERALHVGSEDVHFLEDLLGIRDPADELPAIAPDARRRRLTALINAGAVARTEPAVYVIEDVHWIDEVSESMLADFLAVLPHTHSLALITYRPEYRGVLATIPGGPPITLHPLSGVHASALIAELLGSHPSLGNLAERIAERAAGNPFFVEEMVRDMAERGVLDGERGAYEIRADVAEVDVPATLQAAIGARIDRLGRTAKQTLNAAAVIGSRFDSEVLTDLVDGPDVGTLTENELIEPVRFIPRTEYAFRHPLIQAVAYESQLKSDRAKLHRQLAAGIEARSAGDENAALIAEHLEAAADLRAAFAWHMRAGIWSNFRDIAAAQTSWRRARQVSDRLPENDPERMSMRIAPRTLLCGTAWRLGAGGADTGFDELRDLCTTAGDQLSLAIGTAGQVEVHYMNAHRREASRLASELGELLESIADPTLTVALSFPSMQAKQETAEMTEVLRLAQRVIDLADGDPVKGNLVFPSPLTFAIGMRGVARWCLGIAGWKDDFNKAMAMARERSSDPTILAGVMWFAYPHGIPYGVLLPDARAMRYTSEFLVLAEQFGDNLAVAIARAVRSIVLVDQDDPHREAGFDLLESVRETALNERYALIALPVVDIHIAQEKARIGDVDTAIEMARSVVDDLFASGGCIWNALAITTLVEALLQRGGAGDVADAQAAIDRLAAVSTDPGFVLNEIMLLRLRALLARAKGDEVAYRDHRDRYRKMATDLGFEGHIAMAEAMT
jgi:adenylate cyclase